MISFDSVSKKFGSTFALDDINLEIKQGEFVFIVGPSGAGKSTIIKLILGLVRPTSGKISINDIDITPKSKVSLEKTRKKIGVVFQDYQLVVDRTVEENIALALDIVNFPKSLVQARLDEVLELANLSSRRHLFPSQLSGGELQRTCLARALSVNPELILADEPTGNLDPQNSWNLIKLLKHINETNHTTIIMTSHNYDIVDSLDKRIIRLESGEVKK